jgi:hypothetical protein
MPNEWRSAAIEAAAAVRDDGTTAGAAAVNRHGTTAEAAAASRYGATAGAAAQRSSRGDFWLRRRLRMSLARTPPPTVITPHRSESEISPHGEVGGVFSLREALSPTE